VTVQNADSVFKCDEEYIEEIKGLNDLRSTWSHPAWIALWDKHIGLVIFLISRVLSRPLYHRLPKAPLLEDIKWTCFFTLPDKIRKQAGPIRNYPAWLAPTVRNIAIDEARIARREARVRGEIAQELFEFPDSDLRNKSTGWTQRYLPPDRYLEWEDLKRVGNLAWDLLFIYGRKCGECIRDCKREVQGDPPLDCCQLVWELPIQSARQRGRRYRRAWALWLRHQQEQRVSGPGGIAETMDHSPRDVHRLLAEGYQWLQKELKKRGISKGDV
jgi:DNA-directed RNA polymerase specialized sigma24 family protein